MSKQEEAGLILKLYELRREETMRKARDWYFREFNPQSIADFNQAMFSEHSGHLRMVVTYWDMAAACVNNDSGSYLAISIQGDAGGPRTNVITGDVVVGGQILHEWGLHLIDVNLAMGNLLDIVSQQSKTYLAATAKR